MKKATVKKTVTKKLIKKAQDGMEWEGDIYKGSYTPPFQKAARRADRRGNAADFEKSYRKTVSGPMPGYTTEVPRKEIDKVLSDYKKNYPKNSDNKNKNGGAVKKKMKNGGSLSGLKASTKRVGPVDPKGAFTKVQKKTLAGARGKASLTKDKQLGATKMAKSGAKMKKK
jgi:hypothetical protein